MSGRISEWTRVVFHQIFSTNSKSEPLCSKTQAKKESRYNKAHLCTSDGITPHALFARETCNLEHESTWHSATHGKVQPFLRRNMSIKSKNITRNSTQRKHSDALWPTSLDLWPICLLFPGNFVSEGIDYDARGASQKTEMRIRSRDHRQTVQTRMQFYTYTHILHACKNGPTLPCN